MSYGLNLRSLDMDTAKPLRLMDLPPELRVRIFELFFSEINISTTATKTSSPVHCRICKTDQIMLHFPSKPSAALKDRRKIDLLVVSKRIHEEALPVLQTATALLVIRSWGRHHMHHTIERGSEAEFGVNSLADFVSFRHLRILCLDALPPLLDWRRFPSLEAITVVASMASKGTRFPVGDSPTGSQVTDAGILLELQNFPLQLRSIKKSFPEDIFTTLPGLKCISVVYRANLTFGPLVSDLAMDSIFCMTKRMLAKLHLGALRTEYVYGQLGWIVLGRCKPMSRSHSTRLRGLKEGCLKSGAEFSSKPSSDNTHDFGDV